MNSLKEKLKSCLYQPLPFPTNNPLPNKTSNEVQNPENQKQPLPPVVQRQALRLLEKVFEAKFELKDKELVAMEPFDSDSVLLLKSSTSFLSSKTDQVQGQKVIKKRFLDTEEDETSDEEQNRKINASALIFDLENRCYRVPEQVNGGLKNQRDGVKESILEELKEAETLVLKRKEEQSGKTRVKRRKRRKISKD
eukprot:TRINITY_DN11242_c0_g1_i1.p1 TRINITY_DN11242_c0_g1~~TRINITY_DN11242_c0_g1_i1.p1  ORF type:complete len:195 (+),score=42.30 TRINITY_DN11242_c0_g1_i1:6-590(+)